MYTLNEDFLSVLRDFEANVFNFTWFQPFAVLKEWLLCFVNASKSNLLIWEAGLKVLGVQQRQLGYEVLLFCFCHKN